MIHIAVQNMTWYHRYLHLYHPLVRQFVLWTKFNLVPRVSVLCLPWSLEERPWLRLVI